MKIHRFYAGDLHDKRGPLELSHKVWVHDPLLLKQWLKVLRFRVGDELVLFDGQGEDRLYKVSAIEEGSVGLEYVTQLDPKQPSRHVYLFWSLLKSDNNDLVLQKCTELGVSNFVPIISQRTVSSGFDEVRARRIIIEAVEQCGRSDIPHVREPLTLPEALAEYAEKVKLYVCHQDGEVQPQPEANKPVGVFIGPEGGWHDDEMALFEQHQLPHLQLNQMTLRAETAAISAATKLLV